MSSSGVAVNEACKTAFEDMSIGKNSTGKPKLRYIIYKIEDNEVVIETAVTSGDIGVADDDYEENSKAAYEAFVKDLCKRTDDFVDCRYAVFDFRFLCNRPGAGPSKKDKIIFIQLCPDSAPIKKRMVYASSAAAIKATLGSDMIIPFQVSDSADIDYRVLLNRLIEKYRDN